MNQSALTMVSDRVDTDFDSKIKISACRNWTVLFLLIFCYFVPTAGFAQEYLPKKLIPVRVDANGDGNLTTELAEIELRPAYPDGHGEVRLYSERNGINENCNGEKYSYAEVEIDEEWKGYLKDDTDFKVDADDSQRFWDWVYAGYEKISDIDFSMNCHGYAFGVGDWPTNEGAKKLIGGDIAVPGGPPACYVEVGKKDATIAASLDPGDHSIKLAGTECEDPDTDPEVIYPPGQEPMVQVIIESHEQWLESGTYRQTAVCPDDVDLKLGKLHDNLTFKFFKVNDD